MRLRPTGGVSRPGRVILTCLLALAITGIIDVTGLVGATAGELHSPTPIADVGPYLDLDLNRSEVLKVPWPVTRVSIAESGVADVEMVEPDQVILFALGLGSTDLIVWNETGDIWRTVVRVRLALEELQEEFSHLFPDQQLTLRRVNDLYTVQGYLRNKDQGLLLNAFFTQRDLKFLDMTKIEGPQQVQLKVRVAEVNRNAVRNMSVNTILSETDYFAATPYFSPVNIGIPEGSPIDADLPFTFLDEFGTNPMVTLLAGIPDENLNLFIEALEEKNYLRILAEPTLVALSGEEANFLAGGEFPIPVVQSGGGGESTAITIVYKEFGVRLSFLPTVQGDGSIRLKVAPEVSELSDVGSVEIDGFRIPALITRRSDTTLLLNSGQTFAMAGLLNQTTRSGDASIPILGNLPILGPLFRSNNYQAGESEMVVLVTANLVEPLSGVSDFALPGSLHVRPNDWEFFLQGRIEGSRETATYDEGARLQAGGLSELRGPGAWASYQETASRHGRR